MNIAALMGTAPNAMPDSTGKTMVATSPNNTGGEFKQMLQVLVTNPGTGNAIANTLQNSEQTGEMTTNQNWMTVLLKLFDPGATLPPTLDPTGEALPTQADETAVSLTELMTALQPLVDQSTPVLPLNLTSETIPPLSPAPEEASTTESLDMQAMVQLAGLVNLMPRLPVPTQPAALGVTAQSLLAKAEPGQAEVFPAIATTSGANGLAKTVTPTLIPGNTQVMADVPAESPQVMAASFPQAVQAATAQAQPLTPTVTGATPNLPSTGNPITGANPKMPVAAPAEQPTPATSTAPSTTPSALPMMSSPATAADAPQAGMNATVLSASQPAQEAQLQAQPKRAGTGPEAAMANTHPNVSAPATGNHVTVETASSRPAPELPQPPAVNQIVNSVKLISQQGKTEVRLQLQPEELGKVLVQLRLHDGHVTVRVLAETSQAQGLLQDHLSQLKSALTAQGLQVNSMSIDLGRDASAFDNPNRQSGDSAYQGSGFQSTRSFADDQPAAAPIWSGLSPLSSLYSVDYQA
jgi:flagellar hook-length control protein FliK